MTTRSFRCAALALRLTAKAIQENLKDMYNVDVSPELISRGTDEVKGLAEEWRNPYEQHNFKHVAIVPWSPDMNAYAERFVRSIRQECLNHFIIFTQGQLRRIVKSYIGYYNNYRPHQGLQGIPNGPPEPSSTTGAIRKKPMVFGLHNHYYREAA